MPAVALPGSRTSRSRLAAALLATLLVPGSGCNRGNASPAGEDEKPKRDAIAVRVAPVRLQLLSQLYSSSATLRPEREATVTTRTSGVIEKLLVEEGAWVDEGQTLAVLEDDEQRIALEAARLLQDARDAEHQRALEMKRKGLIAEESYQTERREAREAANAVELARLELSRTVVRAPFAGRVLTRHVDLGATVTSGTAVFDVADLSPLQADVNVPERHVHRLRPGQPVRLTADASGRVATARIERLAPSVDPESGTVKVTISLDEIEGLLPGAFVRVDAVTETREAAHVIPRTALVADGRRWHVFALAADGEQVEKVPVSPGFEEGDLVELLDPEGGPSPLPPGRRVVVLGAPALSDGAPVLVADEASDGGA